ncbi:FAD/NAD(P)-binding domain-containing protein [Meredithblackwellia eburnea MCA 4105]
MSTKDTLQNEHNSPSRVAVVGAGLVGSLCAAMLASRGWTVDLYESRPDPRLAPASTRARSINLALSPRGIEALKSVNEELAARILARGVPMRGRMLHHKPRKTGGETRTEAQDYGVFAEGEWINSISRTLLGIYLLDHLDGLPRDGRGSVKVHFGTKLLEMDMRKEKGVSLMVATKDGGPRTEHFDLVIGADGAYSQVRRQMLRGTRFEFSQSFAKHCYLELSIAPGPDSTFSMPPNFLHIWPRGEFMLIALPNADKSFTLTLFAPKETFEKLQLDSEDAKSEHPVVSLFRKEFPDAFELMGEADLLASWNNNPKDGLITIECSPYHYLDKALLLGDASHGMVPFYGQGMNCGFEDVRVLSTILDHFSASPSSLPPAPLPYSPHTHLPSPSSPSRLNPLARSLATYTEIRTPSLKAIQQLAHSNYAEMASKVADPLYVLRLSLDRLLSNFFTVFGTKEGGGRGGTWESLYRMVTFRYGLAYEEAIRRRRWQGRVLEAVIGGSITGVAVVGLQLWRTHFRQ